MSSWDEIKRYVAFRDCVKIEKKGIPEGTMLVECVAWNCEGKPVGDPQTKLRSKVYIKEFQLGRVDKRSLDLIAKGCCPPQLMEDFIRKERFGSGPGDPVLEAMKLHKRGYFGGGG